MESIKIQGKEYITVNERIKEFRKLHPNGQILNQVMANADGQVMFQCKIIVDDKEYFWKEGVGVLFDDTFTHEVQNNTDEIRVALLLDVKRKIPGFFMRTYDFFIFKLIQFLVILNNTFGKSEMK